MVELNSSAASGLPPALALIETLTGKATLATYYAHAVATAAFKLVDDIETPTESSRTALGQLDSLTAVTMQQIDNIRTVLEEIEVAMCGYRRENRNG